MTEHSVAHSGFTLVRSYPVPVEQVWAAFAEEDQKKAWFGESDDWSIGEWKHDFRVGGHDVAEALARTISRMTDAAFKPGDDVFTTRARGTIVDVRATPSGTWVFGVEDVNGEVGYYTAKALRLAQD